MGQNYLERKVLSGSQVVGIPFPSSPLALKPARFLLRSWDPVEHLARDAVLSEKEAQLGRMFLDVTHGVQQKLSIADRMFTVPGKMERLVRLFV